MKKSALPQLCDQCVDLYHPKASDALLPDMFCGRDCEQECLDQHPLIDIYDLRELARQEAR